MDTTHLENYSNNPVYHDALSNFQAGRWEEGISQLSQLMETYPLEPELRSMRQEMFLRSRMDEYEHEEQEQAARFLYKKIAIRGAILLVLAVLIIANVRLYSNWIKTQLASANIQLEQKVQDIDVAVKYRNAQNLLIAGRPQEAKAILDGLVANKAALPEFDYYMNAATGDAELEQKYNQALQLADQGDLNNALLMLQEIEAAKPTFKDVSIQIDRLQKIVGLDNLFQQANTAFEEQRWVDAVQNFQAIQTQDSTYQKQIVEDRLFESSLSAAETVLKNSSGSNDDFQMAQYYYKLALSLRPRSTEAVSRWDNVKYDFESLAFQNYLASAEAALVDKSDSLDALKTAEGYYQRALLLRPNDPEALAKRGLAQHFLQGQEAFNLGHWDAVITEMEQVVQVDPNYALGTARQTLYEAYLSRGDGKMATGQYELALVDLQRAAVLARMDLSGNLGIFEVQVKLARVQGALGNYQNAVEIYRNAIDDTPFRDNVNTANSDVAKKIDQAEKYAGSGSYRSAYNLYTQATVLPYMFYKTVEHTITSGEYLTMLANKYHSLATEIMKMNQITDPTKIKDGQVIVIPVK